MFKAASGLLALAFSHDKHPDDQAPEIRKPADDEMAEMAVKAVRRIILEDGWGAYEMDVYIGGESVGKGRRCAIRTVRGTDMVLWAMDTGKARALVRADGRQVFDAQLEKIVTYIPGIWEGLLGTDHWPPVYPVDLTCPACKEARKEMVPKGTLWVDTNLMCPNCGIASAAQAHAEYVPNDAFSLASILRELS